MAKKVINKESIIQAYMDYYLTEGKEPASVYHFAKEIGSSEEEFYKHFNSFKGINNFIWKSFFENTIEGIKSEEVYETYSVREKLLSFYFTLCEVLKKKRSFVSAKFPQNPKEFLQAAYLKTFKDAYLIYVQDLVQEGMDTGEIQSRGKVNNKYKEALWAQCVFLIDFWIKDESENFESTDAAVEKTVNLSFELMGASALDSILDFGKFLFHNRDKYSHERAK
ncbi:MULTISPECIES: TetR/AcrR family transcriptional regulator [Persicobacter]|uniref:Tetracyclin repressor-like C-terminal domain-containing protein n=1 Tax=Persicobacter diffluens TaxID=981 RepID=A0AAN4VXJ9_9BACT|nr:TetR/AcrR family transcriptional regulator [Persicobacter sp. CCB-QB2]GJM61297.1 hypothetical protein PEDI_18490 [Persicobacter diffluens]